MDDPLTQTSTLDQPVFMVNAEDENGDHHIFVSMDLVRAVARYETALKAFRNVKANWLEAQVQLRAADDARTNEPGS